MKKHMGSEKFVYLGGDTSGSTDKKAIVHSSAQPQLMQIIEPQPSQALLDFKKKYLG